MAKDLTEYLNDETSYEIARDMAKVMDDLAASKNRDDLGKVDVNFVINTSGKIADRNANTEILFDMPVGTTAYEFKKAMYEREITKDEEIELQKFMIRVANYLHGEFRGSLDNLLRTVITGNAPVEDIPLSTITILDIEIVDYSSLDTEDRFTLKVFNLPGVPVDMTGVLSFIREEKEKDRTKTAIQVIEQERLKGNKMFEGVMSTQLGDKYLWEVYITMFTDYSYSDSFVAQSKAAIEGKKARQ